MSKRSPANPNGSTGPRTTAGKAAASHNATTHGLCSRVILLPGESEAEWKAVLALWVNRSEYGGDEFLVSLAEQAALAQWFMMRAVRRYQETEAALCRAQPDPFLWTEEQHKLLERMLRYRTTHERSYQRAVSFLGNAGSTALKTEALVLEHVELRIRLLERKEQLLAKRRESRRSSELDRFFETMRDRNPPS